MLPRHWLMLLVVFIVGYLAGVWKPQFGQGVVSQIGGLAG
jgi:hypothetical protein